MTSPSEEKGREAMMNMKSTCRWIAPALVLTMGVACASDGGSEDAGHEEEDPAAEACEHMVDGPNENHTATLAAPFPTVNTEHTRHDVTLVDDAGEYRGTVQYEVSAEADYLVFLDRDVPLAFFDSSGNALAVEQSEPVDECEDVVIVKHVPLAVGTVELRFGPTTESTVRLVIEAGGEGHDH
jgi:hypothetical protein